MYKHILIPTDGSELSQKAIREGINLAKSINAQVTLLTTSPPFTVFSTDPLCVVDTPQTYEHDVERRARKRLAVGEDYAKKKGVSAISQHVYAEHPYEAIIEAAPKNQCDLILMASHGRRGLSAIVLGSETNKVLTHSKIPVLVCR